MNAPTQSSTVPALTGAQLLEEVVRYARTHGSTVSAHDRTGAFVADGVESLRAAGYLAAPVPTELGGGGASLADVVRAQRALAAVDSSTALVTSMPLHAALTAAWRWRRGESVVEGMLRKVGGGAVVASTGGGDFVSSTALARPVEDGYVVSGRKRFVSGASAADLFSTWARVEGTDELVGIGLPAGADGVSVDEVWDAVGMRGTGSHDLVLERAKVPSAAVNGRRRIGEPDPLLVGIAAHAFPVILSVYLGVAVGARDTVVARLRGRRSDESAVRRVAGLVDQDLLVAGLALDGLVASIGDLVDPAPEELVRVMLVKRFVAERVQAVLDCCMELGGGAAFRTGSPIGQAWRDVRGAGLHPLGAEQVLLMAGAAAFGEEITTMPPTIG